jgi:FAD/FMN-containing dehydrogenase/Fe-S oxidoreductase
MSVTQPVRFIPRAAAPAAHPLESRLRREVDGELVFDAFGRGRYSTDASIYQIMPVGVVIPRTEEAARIAIQIAVESGVPVLPRGAGTSQCGQTVGAALVIDNSKYLGEVLEIDAERRETLVQPGVVLDHLNAKLRPLGLWYPVDVSTSAQATIGGMAGNNSCGSRSIRYGNMVHNVAAIQALLPSGALHWFGDAHDLGGDAGYCKLVDGIHAIATREAAEIEARWPKVLRRVQGYNLDMVLPDRAHNLAHLLVGSEGTLAWFQRLRLKLAPLPRHKTLGVCHFPSFHQAMALTQHIVKLDPDAVELVDRTMIDLARDIPHYRGLVARFIRGEPDAILLVEFAGESREAQLAKLNRLVELMADLGLPRSVVEVTEPALQKDIWEVRKAGLNIMMSMKGDGKPVSFIEDCAVPLEHLAEYTQRVNEIFQRHGTRGTWYAHASVGTLHVRPVLNMKQDGARKMRAIAEEACALVKRFKGSAFSGEHGDGLVRSEWIEPILGERLTRALGEVKALFDPRDLMNPGKIVRPSKMDDARLFRFQPGYAVDRRDTALDWSEWGGFAAAAEMCNNNGHCRKFDAGTMCPSYRVTHDEQHLTRGRANTLRLALSGQLGVDALTSDAMRDTLDLCVSCKGCKRECPTGVDMARMKVEFLHHYHRRHGYRLRDKAVAYLPRYAPLAARLAPLMNLRDRVPLFARLSEAWLGFSARRSLPQWQRRTFLDNARDLAPEQRTANEVVLLADTFNNYFEPDNLHAALKVLQAGGYRVHIARAPDARPLCCGRTFLAVGMVEEARREARRVIDAVKPFAERGVPIVGLEPSCLLTLRDEYLVLGLGEEEVGVIAERADLFEEFLADELDAGRINLPLTATIGKALLHGHCHQKAFAAMPAVERVLKLIPGIELETIESSCCGMAGAFGYEARHFDVSMQMAEAALAPKIRGAAEATAIVADGTSCRHQIADTTGRQALHVARVLAGALRSDQVPTGHWA